MLASYKISTKILIPVVVILLLSIGLNIYQLLPSTINNKGAKERLRLQTEIDSLLLEYNKVQIQLENSSVIIDSLQRIQKDPNIIINNGKKSLNEKYKIYKSYSADDRVLEWIKKSRE